MKLGFSKKSFRCADHDEAVTIGPGGAVLTAIAKPEKGGRWKCPKLGAGEQVNCLFDAPAVGLVVRIKRLVPTKLPQAIEITPRAADFSV